MKTTRPSAAAVARARRNLMGLDAIDVSAARAKALIDGDAATFDAAGDRLREIGKPAAPKGESKTFAGEVKAVSGKGPRVKRFIITTDTIDRDGDVVVPKGLDFSEYLRNPVFLWSHQFHLPPVGKCVDMGLAGDHVVWADFEFAQDEFAERVFKLYDGGYMNAVSIGFRTLQSGPPDSSIFMSRPQDASRCQRVIYRALLLEVSAVPIPANPDALQVAVQKGLASTSFFHQEPSMADAIDDKAATLSPARRLVDWVGKHLNWSQDRIEGLTIKEIEDLQAAIPEAGSTPESKGADEKGDDKGKEMPTQTAEGDAVCPKCGMKGAKCMCGKSASDAGESKGDDAAPESGSEAAATDDKGGKCPTCGKPTVECKCSGMHKSAAPVDSKAVAQGIVKSLVESGKLQGIVEDIAKGVEAAVQARIDDARGKV